MRKFKIFAEIVIDEEFVRRRHGAYTRMKRFDLDGSKEKALEECARIFNANEAEL